MNGKRSIVRLAVSIAVALFLAASGVHALTDFGTTEVGNPVERTIWFYNNTPHLIFPVASAPPGYAVVGGSVSASGFSFFSVRVRLTAATPGTFSGLVGYSSSFTSDVEAVTGTVTAPCATPSVHVTGPAQGSTKTPNAAGKVILTANASAPAGIQRVEFLVDGATVASDTAAPYAFAWPARQGSHTVKARAVSTCGASKTSTAKTFSVSCGAVSVALTAPSNGASVSRNAAGNVILKASASHSTGIQKVQFFVDGTLVKTDSSAPFQVPWSATLGGHTAFARAFSKCGNATSSSAKSFTVVP